jgi:hypothetical protein
MFFQEEEEIVELVSLRLSFTRFVTLASPQVKLKKFINVKKIMLKKI